LFCVNDFLFVLILETDQNTHKRQNRQHHYILIIFELSTFKM
jgi:hypothetical protein